jgi:antitoxin VapB
MHDGMIVGVGSLYIDAQQIVLVSNKIEGHRLMNEELIGLQSEIQVSHNCFFSF